MSANENAPHDLYVAYLEPQAGLVVGLWHPVMLRVPASAARPLLDSLRRMGAKASIVETEDAARAEVDDLRERCRGCEMGFGRHVCDRCASETLIAELEASTDEPRRAS